MLAVENAKQTEVNKLSCCNLNICDGLLQRWVLAHDRPVFSFHVFGKFLPGEVGHGRPDLPGPHLDGLDVLDADPVEPVVFLHYNVFAAGALPLHEDLSSIIILN